VRVRPLFGRTRHSVRAALGQTRNGAHGVTRPTLPNTVPYASSGVARVGFDLIIARSLPLALIRGSFSRSSVTPEAHSENAERPSVQNADSVRNDKCRKRINSCNCSRNLSFGLGMNLSIVHAAFARFVMNPKTRKQPLLDKEKMPV